nr:immunoglobulin heavy chain junction region [Mus musculus]
CVRPRLYGSFAYW